MSEPLSYVFSDIDLENKKFFSHIFPELSINNKWFMIHNIWEIKRPEGRIEKCSWGGNYGVVIEQREKDVYRLYFSCGEVEHPNITFEDLVIDVAIDGEHTTRFQCSKL